MKWCLWCIIWHIRTHTTPSYALVTCLLEQSTLLALLPHHQLLPVSSAGTCSPPQLLSTVASKAQPGPITCSTYTNFLGDGKALNAISVVTIPKHVSAACPMACTPGLYFNNLVSVSMGSLSNSWLNLNVHTTELGLSNLSFSQCFPFQFKVNFVVQPVAQAKNLEVIFGSLSFPIYHIQSTSVVCSMYLEMYPEPDNFSPSFTAINLHISAHLDHLQLKPSIFVGIIAISP